MVKAEIINFIKKNGGIEIAQLQKQFGISYKEAKEVICEMISNGNLKFTEGLRYSFFDVPKNTLEQQTGTWRNVRRCGGSTQEDILPKCSSLSEYIKARKRAMDKLNDEDDEDEDNEDCDDEDLNEGEIDEEELRFKALKLCIEKGYASVSMMQRSFPIGYFRACRLIDWMEGSGFISASEGYKPRKVLITQEEFNRRFDHSYEDPHISDEIDEDDDDNKFSALENLLHFVDENAVCDCAPINREEQKTEIQSLVNVFKRIAENKNMSVSADIMPQHNLWTDDAEFSSVVKERIKRLIKSDIKMGKQGAVKKAEAYLEAVRDTHDEKMVQVYERLVYEIKNTSNYLYGQLKKQFSGD